MSRVVINMTQTNHEHEYVAEPSAHPEYLWLGCAADEDAGQDCGEAHAYHEVCLNKGIYEFHPLNWDVTTYLSRASESYQNYDSDIISVAIHRPRTHRHAFKIPYPATSGDYLISVVQFPGSGYTGGCWSDFPKIIGGYGCFFYKSASYVYNRTYTWSDPITVVVFDSTDGVDPMIGNDIQITHLHYYKVIIGDLKYCEIGTYIGGLVKCTKNHTDCFYAVKTDDDTPTGIPLTASMEGYYPPPSGAYPWPPDPAYDHHYLDRAFEVEIS